MFVVCCLSFVVWSVWLGVLSLLFVVVRYLSSFFGLLCVDVCCLLFGA